MYIISNGEGSFPACGSKGFAEEACPSCLRWNSPCFSEKGIPSEMNSSVEKMILGDTPNFMSIVPTILWSSSRFIMEAVFCGANRILLHFRDVGDRKARIPGYWMSVGRPSVPFVFLASF